MFKHKLGLESAVKNIAFVLLGVVIATLGQSALTSTATAHISADELHPQGSTGQAPAAAQWVSCVPINVTTYPLRMHVQCQAPISGISYFAASTADTASAARILSILTTAQVAGRTLNVLYDPADTSGTAIGCPSSDCRLIQAVGFGQ